REGPQSAALHCASQATDAAGPLSERSGREAWKGHCTVSVLAVRFFLARHGRRRWALEQFYAEWNRRPLTQLRVRLGFASPTLRNPCMGLLLSRPFGPPRVGRSEGSSAAGAILAPQPCIRSG